MNPRIIQGISSLLKIFNLEIIKTNPKEAVKFARNYFHGKDVVAAEIGVFFGENARQINKNLNIKKLYLIDPYMKYEEYKNDGAYTKLKEAKKKAHIINNFKNNIWIEEFSEDAIRKIKEELDFIYIDGNHEYEYVKKDLELYWPKIKRGGIISGHDIQYKEVSRAVLEFASKNKLQVNFGERRDWWIIKNENNKSPA
jgi:predicted O-methyltransferase YrrM